MTTTIEIYDDSSKFPLLSRIDATNYLLEKGVPMKPFTLTAWASRDRGPEFFDVKGRAFYAIEELNKFVSFYKEGKFRLNKKRGKKLNHIPTSQTPMHHQYDLFTEERSKESV